MKRLIIPSPSSRTIFFHLFCCALLGFVFAGSTCHAAEIVVEPGVNTLDTAVYNAEEGDTLILKDGIYQVPRYRNGWNPIQDYWLIPKALTIRAESKQTSAQIGISVPGEYYINASSNVVFQGITFLNHLRGGNFTLLECDFSLTNSYGALITAGSNVVLIGNHFQPQASVETSSISLGGTENIIAGNTFQNVYLSNSSSTAWVIGNEFTMTRPNVSSTIVALGGGGSTYSFIAGNRIHVDYTDGYTQVYPLSGGSYNSLIAANLIYLNITSDSNNYGISTGSTSGKANIVNNIIYRTGTAEPDTYAAIRNPGLGAVAGNIVVGHNYTSMIDAPYAQVTNNICQSNQGLCTGQAGMTDTDPMFEDLVNFELASGSPAIDAGPTDLMFADLDRSRNDIGIYGGPWSIEQYDLQRTSDRTEPFVFPLFEAPITAHYGQLSVRALGAARLR